MLISCPYTCSSFRGLEARARPGLGVTQDNDNDNNNEYMIMIIIMIIFHGGDPAGELSTRPPRRQV